MTTIPALISILGRTHAHEFVTLLRRHGYAVDGCGTFADLLEPRMNTCPDLWLIGLSTIDVCWTQEIDRLRRRYPGSSIVVVASHLNPDTTAAALDAGADDVVSISQSRAEFLARIARLVPHSVRLPTGRVRVQQSRLRCGEPRSAAAAFMVVANTVTR